MITAKDILESSVWREVNIDLKADLVAAFEGARPDDTDMLHDIAHAMSALRKVNDELERRMSATTGLKRINGRV